MIELCVDGTVMVMVAGEIGAATAATITDQVAAALDGAPSAVVLMADVTFIDSSGIGALVASRTTCAGRGAPFTIAAPGPRIMLRLTGLDLGLDIARAPPCAQGG